MVGLMNCERMTGFEKVPMEGCACNAKSFRSQSMIDNTCMMHD